MDTRNPEQHRDKITEFPIIGIGASTGGTAPFEAILTALPEKFDAAIVFILHPDPGKKKPLSGILSAKFPLCDFIEIKSGMPVERGKVFVNPPDSAITIESGIFHLKSRKKNGLHLPVDTFFASLAEHARENAVAVILSGTGTDGSQGVREVQCKGGTVIVQDPDTAEFSGMPGSVIEAGIIDEVLAPEDIAKRLVGLVETIAGQHSAIDPEDPTALNALFTLLHEEAGFRFEGYKKSVITRRVLRRMSLQGLVSIDEYSAMIHKNPEEIGRLATDLMIGVTAFFRDPSAWEGLRREVIHPLLADKKYSNPLRVWTPGCSTGEEAYSIAMMLLHSIEAKGKGSEVQVFATDINEAALSIARNGKYPGSAAADIPAPYLKSYFSRTEDGSHIQISKHVRDHVVFAKQNMLTDPPFSKLDLIICRNVLIYLEPEAQEKCLSIFHYALRDDGYLFLGNAETIGHRKTYFKSMGDKHRRLYRRIPQSKPGPYSLPLPGVLKPSRSAGRNPEAATVDKCLTEFARDTLLSLYAPAAVLINNRYEILYFNGPIKRFIEPPPGQSSFDFLSWIPEPMRNRVRGALYNASLTPEPVSLPVSLPDANNRDRIVMLTIRVCREPADRSEVSLIVFSDQAVTQPAAASGMPGLEADQAAIRQLERELATIRDELQTNVEELKSSNEELQSSNEELQASNEEMETSREELQSLNEELVTVNAQLQTKIEEQEETNNDLNNFLSSTNIPTLFLDGEYKVRRFTPAMTRLIKLIPSDVGRPIADMAVENLGTGVLENARTVMDSLVPVNTEIPIGGEWYVRSTQPYRTSDNRIEGVVITYIDITGHRKAENALRESEAKYKILTESIQDAFIAADRELKFTYWNKASEVISGISSEKALGRTNFDLFGDSEATRKADDRYRECMKSGQPIQYENEFYLQGARRFFDVQIFPSDGGVSIISRDITERKITEDALRESEKKFSTMLAAMPIGISLAAVPGGTLYDVNPAWLAMYGYADKAEVIGKTLVELGPVQDAEQRESILNEYRRCGIVRGAELAFRSRTCAPHTVLVNLDTVAIEGLTFVLSTNEDISDRKIAEIALRESEDRFRALSENIPDLIVRFDRNLRLLYANPAVLERTGLSAEQIVGRNAREYGSPEESAGPWEKVAREVFASGKPLRFESSNTWQGKVCVFDTQILPERDTRGAVRAVIAIAHDITERRRLEERQKLILQRFYLILSSMYSGILLVTDENKVEFANQAFCDLFGLKESPENLMDLSADEMIEKIRPSYADPDSAIARIGEIVRQGHPISGEDVGMSCERTFLRNFIPLRLNEKPYGRLWVHVDITERKRAEEALRRHDAELTAANHNLEAFAYSISHDLRNPLHSILACSEVIKTCLPGSDTDGLKALNHIVKSTNRMGQVISDLMSLSKIAMQQLHIQRCNLSEMAQAIFEEMRLVDPARSVTIAIGPDILAQADEGLIWILLQNLIHNAWKFTSRNTDAHIEFGKRGGGNSPEYFVRDNGVGFDMAAGERLFKPFARLHSRQEYSGTGIGLTIVKRIVEKHGGTVRVEAEQDKGATFFFSLGR